jgi:hypothetical protein
MQYFVDAISDLQDLKFADNILVHGEHDRHTGDGPRGFNYPFFKFFCDPPAAGNSQLNSQLAIAINIAGLGAAIKQNVSRT